MEIDAQLEKDLRKTYKRGLKNLIDDYEEVDTEKFVNESTSEVLSECLADDPSIINKIIDRKSYIEGLRPDIISMCTPSIRKYDKNDENQNSDGDNNDKHDQNNDEELDIEGLDDDEINGYIMSEKEAHNKNEMWMKLNAEYLESVKAKEEKLAKEREEGKPEKKKRKPRKKIIGPSNTAGEAIEKMLQEKKISNKINYDILKTLTEPKINKESSIENNKINETEQSKAEDEGKDERNVEKR